MSEEDGTLQNQINVLKKQLSKCQNSYAEKANVELKAKANLERCHSALDQCQSNTMLHYANFNTKAGMSCPGSSLDPGLSMMDMMGPGNRPAE